MRYVISIEGNDDDVEFIRQRCVAAVEEVVEEYDQNLDGEVTVEGQFDED